MAEIITYRNPSISISLSDHPCHSTGLSHSADVPLSYELPSTRIIDASQDLSLDDGTSELREFSLPPVDRGKDAWLCLMGGFILETIVWGFPFAFGVFQDYYTITPPFSQDASIVSTIGSCSMGIMYLGSPLSLFILQRWPNRCRISSFLGLVIACVGIVSSSFATRVWHLLLTQGILYAVGACMLYYPVLLFIDEWFVQRKGLAFGVCWAGSGVAGMLFPFLMRLALSKLSFKVTMWVWAATMAVFICPLMPFIKPRIRASSTRAPRPQHMSFRFLRSPAFLVFQTGNFLQSLGFFAPSLYLPTYSRVVMRESGFGITAPLMVMNAGMVLGLILVGHLTDRWHVANVIFMATILTVFGVFVIWGLSVKFPVLCVFALLYGVVAGSASATWPAIIQIVKGTDQAAPAGLILGIFTAIRGLGAIACGPISAALINAKLPWVGDSSATAYGTRFAGLILYTGITASFGVLGFGAKRMGFFD